MNPDLTRSHLYGKRILVVGGTGFIGKKIVSSLTAAGSMVTIASRSAQPDMGVTWSAVGNGTLDEWVRITQSSEIVVHVAHSNTPSGVEANIAGDFDQNVRPLLSLLDACRKNEVARFVFASSGGTVYGNAEQDVLIDECHPTNPTSSYGIHKLLMEKYIQAFQQKYPFIIRILRLANPYGPFQPSRPGFGIVPTFIAALKSGQPIHVIGDGSMRRDYIYIDDVAEAFLAACVDAGPPFEVLNIGSGEAVSVNELLAALERLSKIKGHVSKVPPRAFDVPYNALNINRARSLLKWHPKISLDIGLGLTLGPVD
jgi:UDP-glucose 4-epimerase